MEDFTKGACVTMCPRQEISMREAERLLHRLEIAPGTEKDKYPKADPEKTVKCFSRSAADVRMAVPEFLRPFHVLNKTVAYLVKQVLQREDVSELTVYNFVCDRLRAVRQDMTIQALPPEQCVVLLEPMVLFHTLYGYKLCEYPLIDYDPVLNNNLFLECMKQLLLCYDAIDNLEDTFSHLRLEDSIQETKGCLTSKRSIMESLYILSNLADTNPLRRYLSLPRKYRCDVKLSYSISVETMRGNIVRLCRLARKLSFIELCAFNLCLPHIQRRALEVYSCAYNSKQLLFPSAVLSRCLMFNSIEETGQVCQYYGLQSNSKGILFDKSNFKFNKLLQPKKILMEQPANIF